MRSLESVPAGIEPATGIIPATREHITGILAVQQCCSLASKIAAGVPQADIERGGFLVHMLDESELEELVEDPEVTALVRTNGDEVVGYALGYLLSSWKERKPEWSNTVILNNDVEPSTLKDEQALYIRHVATGPTARPGAGAELSRTLIETSRQLGCTAVVGEALLRPYLNRPTHVIHARRLGFQDIGRVEEMHEGEEYEWTLYRKFLEN